MPGHKVPGLDVGYDLVLDVPAQSVHVLPAPATGLWIESDVEMTIGALANGENRYVLCSAGQSQLHLPSNPQTIPASSDTRGIKVYVAGRGITITFGRLQMTWANSQALKAVGVKLVEDEF